MALKKPIMTKYGVEASYWKVNMLTINKRREEASFVLDLYIDNAATEFISTKVISLNEMEDKTMYNKYFKDETETYNNVYQACYECAKEMDAFFSDAVDC